MNSGNDSQARLEVADQLLLAPYDVGESAIRNALGLISQRRIDFADLYFQLSRREAWQMEEGLVSNGSFEISRGVGVRAISGERCAFAYTEDISERSLREAARTVRTVAAANQHQRVRAAAPRTPSAAPHLYEGNDPVGMSSSEEKVALLKRIDSLARAQDTRVTRVTASVGLTYEVMLVARFDGLRAADVRPMIKVAIEVMIDDRGRREVARGGGGGRITLCQLDDEVVEGWVRQTVRRAIANLDSRAAPAGEMTLVLGPGGPGILLHEAVGHGLEGDCARKRTSAFAGLVGQRVAAKGVTVVDDGTLPQKRGSLNVDDEGTAGQKTVLIEDGILRGFLCDHSAAAQLRCAPTGNARRESYRHRPLPRMTNTFMMSGEVCPEEIVASIKRGLYATAFDSGQVDITSGNFVFRATEAYWVENGQVQFPVRGATIVGNGKEVLQRISMIGNDGVVDTGVNFCSKMGQRVPVSVGQPTVRIDGITVGGTR